MMPVITALLMAYAVVCVVGYVVARLTFPASANKMRLILFALSALVPPITLWVLIKTILFGKTEPLKYNDELAKVEDEIEAERVRIFGGKRIAPSISEAWKRAYLQQLAKTAQSVTQHVDTRNDSSLFTGVNLAR